MKLETANAIVKAAEDAGKEVRLTESYSGRGMFGKMTAGVIGSHSDVMIGITHACYRAGRSAMEAELENDGTATDSAKDMLHELGRLRQDNMGYDIILY